MTLVDTPADEVGADAQLVAATCGSAIIVARRPRLGPRGWRRSRPACGTPAWW